MRPIVLHGHQRSVTSVQYNQDGDLLFSTSKDASAQVWDSTTGERLGSYDGHRGAVRDANVNFTSTLLATAGADSSVRVWDVASGECLLQIDTVVPARCVGFSHGDDQLLVVTDGAMGAKPALQVYGLPIADTVGDWKAAAASMAAGGIFATPIFKHECPEQVTHAAWGPTNETIYFSTDDGYIVIYDTEKQVEKTFKQVHEQRIKRFAFDRGFVTLVTASVDQSAKLIAVDTLKELAVYETDKPVNASHISPLLDHVLVGGGHDAQDVAKISTHQKIECHVFHKILEEHLGSLPGHFGPINALCFSPSGRSFVTGGEDGFIRIHHLDPEVLGEEQDVKKPNLKQIWE